MRDILPLKLTPTTRKILQFIADGGERGRMELQVITVGGSWSRRIKIFVTLAMLRMRWRRSISQIVCA